MKPTWYTESLVKALKTSFEEYGNPFSESSSDLLVLDARGVADKEVVDT